MGARIALLNHDEDPWSGKEANGAPILLIHGFAGSPRLLCALARHLSEELGRPIVRIGLGAGLGDIRSYARFVTGVMERAVQTHAASHADIVGHSLGGMVATYTLKYVDRGHRIRRVVTLGAPHGGTPIAWLGVVFLGWLGPALWQMRPNSALVRDLEAAPTPSGTQLVAVSAPDDGVVPPRYASVRRGPGQWNRTLAHGNHSQLITAPDALAITTEALRDEPSGTAIRDGCGSAKRWAARSANRRSRRCPT